MVRRTYGLESIGLRNTGQVYRNLPVPELLEHAIVRNEGVLASSGALCIETGKYTGRSPKDKYIVDEPSVHDEIDWGAINVPISCEAFDRLWSKVAAYIQGRDLYIFDGYVGADPAYRMGVRVVTELASQSLFCHQLFLRPSPEELEQHQADFTVISVPGLEGDSKEDGLRSEAFILVSFEKRLVLVGGSRYAGEIKKSIFSFMNYFMTKRAVLPMHCSANMGERGDTALFFGLSGTGKTTLSADPQRRLIGDDEHGWSDSGIFNFEGGCYAKLIRLSRENEPQIWNAMRFGAIIENVVLDEASRVPDYDDDSLTENTRGAYPAEYIPDCVIPGVGGHPRTVVFLTADAYGVLPPIARLTKNQAMYHFLSGYTSKLAGTERGVTEPQATFSACFAAPFLPLPPKVYANMLGERIDKHGSQVFMVNTGWSGGPYGVGERIEIAYTRAMVSAALTSRLNDVEYAPHPVFGVLVPRDVPEVPSEILDPRNTWSDASAYDGAARALARKFAENFGRFSGVPVEIASAGPAVG
jgi:phosphoenolpyruvate carboxykinase (ATP)